MARGIPFDEFAEFIKKLDKVAADGSSNGTLEAWLKFVEDGEGKWGVEGAVALSETLAKLLELVPIQLRADVLKSSDWVRDYSLKLRWTFVGKPGVSGGDKE